MIEYGYHELIINLFKKYYNPIVSIIATYVLCILKYKTVLKTQFSGNNA